MIQLRKNNITNLLNLQGVIQDKIQYSKNLIEVWISCPVKQHVCPCCSKNTSRVHDYYLRSFNHIKVGKRTTRIYYKRRRYVQIVVKSLLKKIHLLKGFTDILMTWLTLYLMTLLTFIVSLKLAKTTICHLRMLLDL